MIGRKKYGSNKTFGNVTIEIDDRAPELGAVKITGTVPFDYQAYLSGTPLLDCIPTTAIPSPP
jgi:hypothetical protein